MGHRVAIVTDEPGWHGARLRDALAERGCESVFVSLGGCSIELTSGSPGVLLPGFDGLLPDGVFVRGIAGGSLEEVVFYLDILHALRELGVTVYNDGRAIERSVDKAMTSFLLHRAGLSTPPTWAIRSPERAQALWASEGRAGHQLVLKPLFGAQGNGLRRIGAGDTLPPADLFNGVYYLQRFVDSDADTGCDWRVFVVGGRAVAAMIRRGEGWINNIALGARCSHAVLDESLALLAQRATEAVGLCYAGVDLVRDRCGRFQVIEVNGVPAWKGLQSVCSVDLASMLADDFLACCTRAMQLVSQTVNNCDQAARIKRREQGVALQE